MPKAVISKLAATAAALAMVLPSPAALAHEDHAQAPAAPASSALAAPALASPPEDARTWVIVSTGGQHGRSRLWTDGQGVRWSRESVLLRGFSTEIDQQMRLAPDGTMRSLTIRGSTPEGDAAESYAVDGARYTYRSGVDEGAGAAKAGLVYSPFGGTVDTYVVLTEALIKAPGRTIDLAPTGRAAMEPLGEAVVTRGGERKTVQAYAITGLGLAPSPVWMDGDRFFAAVGFLSYLPEGWEANAPALSKAQDEALAKRAPAIMERFGRPVATPVAFRGIRIFDAENLAFREGMTVVVRDGRIAAVGPAGSTPIPAGAKVFEGAGRTLVPGLWDSHMHYGGDETGPLLIANGITSVRDPGNRPAESIARKRRIDEGQLLGPRIVPVMLIDGPGPLAAQMAVTVTNEAEARAAVQRAKRDGFTGVKLYGSLDKTLVAPIADEARKQGLRVQGHVPRTMRPLEAVRAGYSEITHINFVMMQAMPDSVINESNGLQRFYGPGRYASGVDLKSPEMSAYMDELARRGTVVDPTLAVFEGGYTQDRGQLGEAYAPYAGTLPPLLERYFKAGGFKPLPDLSRDDMRRSFAKLLELTAELHRRGVPIVAGTDGAGIELVRDIELYAQAGMTPAEALATATIVPARVFGLERETGSITVGKRAELVMVEGDPGRRIGDLRRVETVVMGDKLIQADELRSAIGITGAPR